MPNPGSPIQSVPVAPPTTEMQSNPPQTMNNFSQQPNNYRPQQPQQPIPPQRKKFNAIDHRS